MIVPLGLYPVVIYEDRYSRGWIAVGESDLEGRDLLRIAEEYADERAGPFGDDNSNDYWHSNIPVWAFVSDSPNNAIEGLINKFQNIK